MKRAYNYKNKQIENCREHAFDIQKLNHSHASSMSTCPSSSFFPKIHTNENK